jgi:hypothetical protein
LNIHSRKQSSSAKIDLTSSQAVAAAGEQPKSKAKAHAILMIIAWMFFVPTAIITARYFKFVYPDTMVLGKQIWFTIHRSCMIFSYVLSFIAFLVILSYLDWQWIDPSESLNFAHSIFGIVVLGLALFQVI